MTKELGINIEILLGTIERCTLRDTVFFSSCGVSGARTVPDVPRGGEAASFAALI